MGDASGQESSDSALFLTIDLSPNRDNTLYEHSRGLLSNGVGQHFFAGQNDLGLIRRGVIAFTVADAIPAGSTIFSATLRLNMSKTESGAQPVTLHRLTESWGEGLSDAPDEEEDGADAAIGDATWLFRFFNFIFWTEAGGDFVPTASATTTVAGLGPYTWRSPGMVADVQAWLDDPDSNHGWLLRGNESANSTTKRFDTKEHPTEDNRPLLSVAYLSPPVLTLTKEVNNPTPFSGQSITYTVVVTNSGSDDVTEALISDTMPAGIHFVGPVTLDPPGSGNIGTPPTLVSDLVIPGGDRITLTFPVKVGVGLAVGTQITNTVAATSAEVSNPVAAAVAITVEAAQNVYLPVIFRSGGIK